MNLPSYPCLTTFGTTLVTTLSSSEPLLQPMTYPCQPILALVTILALLLRSSGKWLVPSLLSLRINLTLLPFPYTFCSPLYVCSTLDVTILPATKDLHRRGPPHIDTRHSRPILPAEETSKQNRVRRK